MDKMDLVMVTYNRKEFTQKAVKCLHDRTRTPFRIIVVDNNSNDGSQKDLYEMKQAGLIQHLILLEENYGIHMAKNYGLALVRSRPYYIDTDNDLLCPNLEPDWIVRLTELMSKYPNFGAISCRPQVLVGRSGTEFNVPDEVVKFSHTGAHLRIMRTDKVRECGGWEKTWSANRNHEDSFIAGKLKELGLDVGYARDVRCFHMFSTNWGYKEIPPEVHGHRPMWPPSESWDNLMSKLNPETFAEL